MRERTRRSERPERITPGPGPLESAGGNMNLSEIRQQGESFLRAAEEAINNALSGDSQSFLDQSRQQGGQ